MIQGQHRCADKKPEGSCHQLILGSYVLMALGRFLLGQVFEECFEGQVLKVVLPVHTAMKHSWETTSLVMVLVNVAL